VGEAPGAAKTEAHPVSGSIAVTESQIDVRDAGALVFEHKAHPGFSVLPEGFEAYGAAAGVMLGNGDGGVREGDKRLRRLGLAANAR